MISSFAYQPIAGLPLVAYLGIATLVLLLSTGAVGYLNFRGDTRIPFKWHPRLAKTTILFAIVHAILALSAYLKY